MGGNIKGSRVDLEDPVAAWKETYFKLKKKYGLFK